MCARARASTRAALPLHRGSDDQEPPREEKKRKEEEEEKTLQEVYFCQTTGQDAAVQYKLGRMGCDVGPVQKENESFGLFSKIKQTKHVPLQPTNHSTSLLVII